ncbi:MerR family transcriptional regulator [Janibacter sp. YB324]|uniref:MerR family transcriptional regulator n=1 Tax=Janibacter sp. YB324 TaxID=2761047 RepID=UPI001CB89B4D|nr:MerR family transcriptional regulator [Janibacter sp. YB324]
MTDTPGLMSIGEFSSRSRLSVRMLRHYGEHGILVPADVVAASGYRRYAPEQLADAAHVRRLRDVGFTVSAISVLLAAHGTESYRQALALQRESLGDELRAAKERLALIDQLLDQEGTAMSTITVTRTTVPARTVVALRGTVPAYDQEGRLWERLMPELGRQGLTPMGPCGVFEHDPEYREADPTLSIWLPVPPGTTVQAPLEVHELPEQGGRPRSRRGAVHADQRGPCPHRRAGPVRGADPRPALRHRRRHRRPRLQPLSRRPLAGRPGGPRHRGVRAAGVTHARPPSSSPDRIGTCALPCPTT